jgi:hypothetical protein
LQIGMCNPPDWKHCRSLESLNIRFSSFAELLTIAHFEEGRGI